MKNYCSVCVAQNTKYEITASAIQCGEDWVVIVTGGTTPHVGGISIKGIPSKENCNYSLSLSGHKDHVISSMFAESIANALNCTVAVCCGIHIDNASKSELELLISNSKKCCQELLCKLENL